MMTKLFIASFLGVAILGTLWEWKHDADKQPVKYYQTPMGLSTYNSYVQFVDVNGKTNLAVVLLPWRFDANQAR